MRIWTNLGQWDKMEVKLQPVWTSINWKWRWDNKDLQKRRKCNRAYSSLKANIVNNKPHYIQMLEEFKEIDLDKSEEIFLNHLYMILKVQGQKEEGKE